MRIVRIDVSTNSIVNEEIKRNSKFFLLGARGLSSRIINDEVPPTCDPIGQENKLIIANGILTGSPFPNSARTSIGAKSPLTNGVKEANVGGRPSFMLARYGIRALVLENSSDTLKIIIINDQGIKLEPAEIYKGLGNYELHSKLRERFGEKIGVYSIGPAGEHLMKSATVATNDLEGYPSRHAARGGLGAVMGSKKIKAIIILPTKINQVKIIDIKKFREVSTPLAKNLASSKEAFSIFGTALGVKAMSGYGGLPTKNFRMGTFKDAEKISGELLHELVIKRGGKKRLPCSPTCVIKCSNLFVDENGNHVTSSLEYETIALNGSNLMINNLDAIAHIDHLCDDIGVDTIEFGCTVGVAMDVGNVPWSDADKVFDILKEIGKNSEIGKLYGNGVVYLGNSLKANRIPQVKGQGISGYDPRVFKGMGVTYATSPMGADHTAGAAIAGRSARLDKDYGAVTEDKGKLELSYELQIYTTVLDSMGCCYFIGPSWEMMNTISNAINAMYGLALTRDDIINIGQNILKSELDFNQKAGIIQDSNDLPHFFRNEPSNPSDLKISIPKSEFSSFWNRLTND